MSALFSCTARVCCILVVASRFPMLLINSRPRGFQKEIEEIHNCSVKFTFKRITSSAYISSLHHRAWKKLFSSSTDGCSLLLVRWRERCRFSSPWFWSLSNRYTKQRRPCCSSPSGLWSLWEAEAWRKDPTLFWWCCAQDRFASEEINWTWSSCFCCQRLQVQCM